MFGTVVAGEEHQQVPLARFPVGQVAVTTVPLITCEALSEPNPTATGVLLPVTRAHEAALGKFFRTGLSALISAPIV